MKIKFWLVSMLLCSIAGYTQGKKWVVAQDGSGRYNTVQAALNAVPVNNKKPITIYVKNGVYKEKLTLLPHKDFVTILGEDKFNTILTYDDHTGKVAPNGTVINTNTSASFVVMGDYFKVENITIENAAGFTAGQAVGLEVQGDKAIITNCRITGNQDILFLSKENTRQYFYNCYIEGTTDFIFGPSAAWFQQCHIHSKKNSHVTAASTPQSKAFGFVFNDCVLTGDTSLHMVSLGRPWRPFASVVYLHCYLGDHIKPEGWANWNNTDSYKTARYAEYKNYGPGAYIPARVNWAQQLSNEEANKITFSAVFGDWNPEKK